MQLIIPFFTHHVVSAIRLIRGERKREEKTKINGLENMDLQYLVRLNLPLSRFRQRVLVSYIHNYQPDIKPSQ